jgi:hypothetical protein
VEDDGDRVVVGVGTDRAAHFVAINVFEPDVEQDRIRVMGVEHLQGLSTGMSMTYIKSRGGEQLAKRVAVDLVIVDCQHAVWAFWN